MSNSSRAEPRGTLKEDFNYYDLNRDGKLTLGEFIRFMKSLAGDITLEECQIGFDEIDTNRNGAIEFAEFSRWWTEP